MMSAKYFEYYTIILRGAVFSWTHCSCTGCQSTRHMTNSSHCQFVIISAFIVCLQFRVHAYYCSVLHFVIFYGFD